MTYPILFDEPSDEQLLERLDKDIAWLQARGAWSRGLFERAVERYLDARRSDEGLEDFIARYASPSWLIDAKSEDSRSQA